MRFEYPGFLWAAILLLIPILIHLFHFRRYKKIIFPHVRFLQDIQRETQSVKKLKNFLVLLARLLFLLFLIFAFAQPMIPNNKSRLPKTDDIVTIYVDNSFSMEATGKEGPVFEEAKNKARAIVNAYENNTRYLLVDNSSGGKGRVLNREDVIQQIDELEITHVPHGLNETMKMIRYSLEQKAMGNKQIFLISDFQQPEHEPSSLSFLDSSYQITAIALEPNKGRNISIDTAWLAEPQLQLNEAFTLKVKVTNRGSSEITEAMVVLDVDGSRKSAAGFDLAPGESEELSMGVTLTNTGWQKGILSLEDEDLSFDNKYFITFNIKKSIQILVVNGKGSSEFIDKLFQKDPYFTLINSDQGNLDISDLKKSDLLILNELDDVVSGISATIKSYVDDGGCAFIVPKPDAKADYLSSLCLNLGLPSLGPVVKDPMAVTRVDLNNPIFSKVYEKESDNPNYPHVEQHYEMEKSSASQRLINLRNEDVFLSGNSMGNGHAYLLAAPLRDEWSGFHRHSLFAIVLLKMALSRSFDFPLAHTISKINLFRAAIESGSSEGDIHMKNEDVEWMPVFNQLGLVSYIDAGDAQIPAGNLEIKLADSLVQIASFNYHRRESGGNRYDANQLANIFSGSDFTLSTKPTEEVGRDILQNRLGKRFWKLCVILSLIFLAIEILLLRLWPNRQV